MATAGVKLIDLALGKSDDPRCRSAARSPPFTGRFANLWGVFDIVRWAGGCSRLDPTQPDPTVGAVHLARVDDDTLKFTRTTGYGSFGEPLSYHRAGDGTIVSVRGGSATTSYPLDGFAAAVGIRTRITLGDPVTPTFWSYCSVHD